MGTQGLLGPGQVNGVLSDTLAASLDCLRKTYIGTLKRCLEKLGQAHFKDETLHKESAAAVAAFNQVPDFGSRSNPLLITTSVQLLNAAYSLELNLPTREGIMNILWQNIKQVLLSSLSRSESRRGG